MLPYIDTKLGKPITGLDKICTTTSQSTWRRRLKPEIIMLGEPPRPLTDIVEHFDAK